MKKEVKNKLILFIATTIICCAYFLPNILSHLPLVYGTDLKPEQVFYYMEFSRLAKNFIKHGVLPFYSWNFFLGNNYYASSAFYGSGDIFNWLGLLFRKINVFDRFLILEIIKFYVATFSMYELGTFLNKKPYTKIITSLAFAFSSWAIFYSGQVFFLSFYCLIPLYFLGLEHYLQHKKYRLFLFMSVLLAINNWYFFYTLSFFTVIYYLYRYYVIHHTFKDLIKDTLPIVGYYSIAVGISMFHFLPAILDVSKNIRLGKVKNTLFFRNIKVYLHLIATMFSPNYMYIYANNIFEAKFHYIREICLWATSLLALTTITSLFSNDNHLRKANRTLFLVLSLIAICPFGNSMMHGFSDPSFRWFFLFTFMNIILSMDVLDNNQTTDFKLPFTISLIITIFIIPLTTIITNNKLSEFIPQWSTFIFSALFLIVYAIVLFKVKKEQVLLLIVVIELSFFGNSLYLRVLNTNRNHTYNFFHNATHVLQDNPKELNNYLNSLDEKNTSSYYRVFVPHDELYWQYSHNMNLTYELKGLMTYHSTYSPSINKLAEIAPQIRDFDSFMIFNIKDRKIIDFLATKYAIVQNKEQLPSQEGWKLLDDNYHYGLQVYENKNHRPLCKTQSTVITYDNLTTLDDLKNNIVCLDKDEQTLKNSANDNDSVMENISYYNNELHGTITTKANGIAMMTLPYEDGWKILVNNKKVPVTNTNGGFMSFPVEPGYNQIDCYFVPSGFKIGVIISLISLMILCSLEGYHWFKQRNNHKIN